MSQSSWRGGRSATKLGGRRTTIIDIVQGSTSFRARPETLTVVIDDADGDAGSVAVRALDGRSGDAAVCPRCLRLIHREGEPAA